AGHVLVIRGELLVAAQALRSHVVEVPQQTRYGRGLAALRAAVLISDSQSPQGVEIGQTLRRIGPARCEVRDVKRSKNALDSFRGREHAESGAQRLEAGAP